MASGSAVWEGRVAPQSRGITPNRSNFTLTKWSLIFILSYLLTSYPEESPPDHTAFNQAHGYWAGIWPAEDVILSPTTYGRTWTRLSTVSCEVSQYDHMPMAAITPQRSPIGGSLDWGMELWPISGGSSEAGCQECTKWEPIWHRRYLASSTKSHPPKAKADGSSFLAVYTTCNTSQWGNRIDWALLCSINQLDLSPVFPTFNSKCLHNLFLICPISLLFGFCPNYLAASPQSAVLCTLPILHVLCVLLAGGCQFQDLGQHNLDLSLQLCHYYKLDENYSPRCQIAASMVWQNLPTHPLMISGHTCTHAHTLTYTKPLFRRLQGQKNWEDLVPSSHLQRWLAKAWRAKRPAVCKQIVPSEDRILLWQGHSVGLVISGWRQGSTCGISTCEINEDRSICNKTPKLVNRHCQIQEGSPEATLQPLGWTCSTIKNLWHRLMPFKSASPVWWSQSNEKHNKGSPCQLLHGSALARQ